MPSKLLIIDPRDAGEDHPLVDYLRANARSVFETPEWYRLLSMMSMRSGDTPLLCGVQDDGGTVVAALPLLLTNETRRGRAIHRYGSLTNYFSLHYRLVAAPDLCDEAYQLLGREVRGRRAGLLRFDALQADDVPALEAVLSAAGLRSHRYEHFANWIEPVDGRSFEQYFDGRPSVLRSTHRRRRRKLQKSFKTRIVIYLGQEPDFEEGKAAYGKVYASSWKKGEQFPDFVGGFLDLLAARGALRLGVLYAEEEPIAAQLWFLDGTRTIIYKLAYDEAYTEYSPGLVLSVEMFRHAIDIDKVSIIDYGSGDDAYKSDWMSVREIRWGLEAYDVWRPSGAMLAAHSLLRRLVAREKPK